MTAIPQMECCTMLGIDPKTLRNWLRHAHLHFVAHPTDARLKCLTLEQVQQLVAFPRSQKRSDLEVDLKSLISHVRGSEVSARGISDRELRVHGRADPRPPQHREDREQDSRQGQSREQQKSEDGPVRTAARLRCRRSQRAVRPQADEPGKLEQDDDEEPEEHAAAEAPNGGKERQPAPPFLQLLPPPP